MMTISNVYNRREKPGHKEKRYAETVFRGRQFVESAELNETQDLVYDRMREVGDASLGQISLREGGTIVVDQAGGIVRLGSAKVWAGGYMHSVPSAVLEGVPMVGTVAIGIAVEKVFVTEVEDADLAGIVPDTASHGSALGARVRYDAVWATGGDTFYPIYTLVNAQLPNEVVAPHDTSAERAV